MFKNYRLDRHPVETKRCGFCQKKFNTPDPTKVFCKASCRVRHWKKFNSEKAAAIQKRYRKKADEDLMNTFGKKVLD